MASGWRLTHLAIAMAGVCCATTPVAQHTPDAAGRAPAHRAPLPGAPAGVTAFENVAVIPMDSDRVLTGQTVLVQGGWITAIGPADKVPVPQGAVRIDGSGQYLIPGLADMHAHLLNTTDAPANDSSRYLPHARERGATWLANGVTTVRAMEPTDYGAGALLLKALEKSGPVPWPHVYTSGAWGPPQYINNYFGHEEPKTRPELRLDSVASYVAAYKRAGYDHVKLRNETSAAVIDSVLAAARRVHILVTGHIPDVYTIERAIKNGYSCIEHPISEYRSETVSWGDNMDTAKVRALAEQMRRAGVWNTPTLAHYEGKSGHAHGGESMWEKRRVIIKIMHDAGVNFLLGTDISRIPEAVHYELQSLVGAGFTPYEALATGTRNVATYFGTLGESGTVSVGKRADLVLLKKNPLEDIHNTTKISGVMLSGRWRVDTLPPR